MAFWLKNIDLGTCERMTPNAKTRLTPCPLISRFCHHSTEGKFSYINYNINKTVIIIIIIIIIESIGRH